jgi:23S rRNA-intervening sequence protein
MASYKDLIVWQKSYELSPLVYAVTKEFPKEEVFGLTFSDV